MNMRAKGFTIVELIVIIVIVGILAGVAIVGYGAWRNQTTVNVLKSDLQSVTAAMEDSRNFSDSGYPLSIPSTFSPSPDTEMSVGPLNDAYRYCITSRSTTTTSLVFSVTNFNKSPRIGDCSVQVTTFAGSGSATYSNGSSTTGGLPGPSGIMIAKSGTMYVTEISGHRIRSISPEGTIGLMAGSGTVGWLDGSSTSARFNQPGGATEDPEGNLYIADTVNNRIRKITPAGNVETFAGTGTAGDVNTSNPLTSQFRSPQNIVRGKDGSFYISESAGNRIRKISPTGNVEVFAGSLTAASGYADGAGANARFLTPYGITIDDNQNIYVADYGNHRIRKISPSGLVTTVAGSGVSGNLDGKGTAAQFNQPFDVSIDANQSLYISTRSGNMIRRITPDGEVKTLAGTGVAGSVNGDGASATFNAPRGIAVGPDGLVYVADYGSRRIRLVTF